MQASLEASAATMEAGRLAQMERLRTETMAPSRRGGVAPGEAVPTRATIPIASSAAEDDDDQPPEYTDAELDAQLAAAGGKSRVRIVDGHLALAPEPVVVMPPIEEVLPSVPAHLQEKIEELFRGRWSEVRPVKPHEIKE